MVFEVNDPLQVAKLYLHPLERDKAEKLELMASQASASIQKIAAWPTEVLRDAKTRAVQGFLMPKISGCKPVHLLYGVQSRRNEFPKATWEFLAGAAMNAATAFAELHQRGHVIGDVNENNVLISPRDYTVSLIDCDSFQIRSPSRVFVCEVGVPLYTPPELQGKTLKNVERTPNHDRFGLAVLVFQLLFLGRHPFFGRFTGHGEMPPERAIRELRFAYGRRAAQFQMLPPPFSLPLTFLPPPLVDAFERAFEGGAQRPTAEDWRSGLQTLLRTMGSCSRDPSHRFPTTQAQCPWCATEAQGGPAFFVAIQVGNAAVFVCRAADLDDLIAQLGNLAVVDRQEPQPPTGLVVTPRPLPITAIEGAGLARRAFFIVSAALALVTVGVWLVVFGALTLGSAIAGTSLAVFVVALLVLLFAQRSGELAGVVDERKAALSNAEQASAELKLRWQTLVMRFETTEREVRSKIDVIRREYGGLQQQHDAENRRLNDDKETSQRREFLRSKFIASYEIKGIKAGRRAALRTYNIETALDVLTLNVQQVPGFGPKLRSTLVGWAKALESNFRFDARKGVSQSELRALVGRYQQKKTSLRTSAQSLLAELQRLTSSTGTELNALRSDLLGKERQRLQAVAEMGALDGLVARPAKGLLLANVAALSIGVATLFVQHLPVAPRTIRVVEPPPAPSQPPPLAPSQPSFVKRVIPRACTLRAAPSTEAEVITGVQLETEVGVSETENGWRRIRLTTGQEGWTGPKCWLPTAPSGSQCREDSDCRSEKCLGSQCE
ncbi:MAG: SH3 domain-containing protein [Archangium sp.]|nr:SH3 domain-containing protein [Archangium sp.]